MTEPILKLKSVDNQVAALNLVKARAAVRTRRRILQSIEDLELKDLEKKIATGEALAEDIDAVADKTTALVTPKAKK